MDERERFEKWAMARRDKHNLPHFVMRDSDGGYVDFGTNIAWESWQAALESRWISVDERLPESTERQWSHPVIALSDTGEIFKLSCMGTYWQRTTDFVNSDASEITDWIPIPIMPK